MKLLSPTSTNLAMRASDPSYPAICTQSMIGNNTYDVIIIEYERRYDMGLEYLVKRLRDRFPDATIIVTNVWTFMNIMVNDKDNKFYGPFRNWLRNAGYDSNTIEAWAHVRKVTYNNPNITFSFVKNKVNVERDNTINKIANDYNARIFDWRKRGNMLAIILRYLPLYGEDFVHWSAKGHVHAAKIIKRILYMEKTTRSDRLGTFGEGDVCSKWLSSGKIKDTNELLSTNGEMIQFDDRWGGKFSLEFPYKGNSNVKEVDFDWSNEGYITINNPFDGRRELSITYMTTGPAPSIYPKTILWIENPEKSKEHSFNEMIEVDPTDKFYEYPVHVQFSKVIGVIPQGISKIYIHPLEAKDKPFRVVGFSITNESKKISNMYSRPMREDE